MSDLGVKLEDVTIDMLGRAKSIKITKDNTTIVDGAGDKAKIEERTAQIKGEIENTKSDFDREKLQERMAKLAGGVAVIKVGAATESEMKEIKHRIEDALQATRAAVEEGIVAGGGVAFMDALPALEELKVNDADEQIGVNIIKKALTAPVATIAANAGYEGQVIVEKIKNMEAGHGLDSASGEWGDMIEMGVLDPVKVTRHHPAERRLHRRPDPHHRGHGDRRSQGHDDRGRHRLRRRPGRPGRHVLIAADPDRPRRARARVAARRPVD